MSKYFSDITYERGVERTLSRMANEVEQLRTHRIEGMRAGADSVAQQLREAAEEAARQYPNNETIRQYL